MKRSLTTSLTLASLAAVALSAGGCVYATHAPGEGTRLHMEPVVVESAPVVYRPAPVYYGPPVSLNFGFGGWGHGWGHHHHHHHHGHH